MKKLLNSVKNYVFGPFKGLWKEEKKKVKDPNNFAMIVSFVFSVAFFAIFLGFDGYFKLIGESFTSIFTPLGYIYIIIFALLIGFAVAFCFYAQLDKYLMVISDAIFSVLFFVVGYFVFYVTKQYGVYEKNWLLYLIMMLPTFILLFTLLIRFVRLIGHVFDVEDFVSDARKYDYEMKRRYKKHTFKRFSLYMKDNWGQVLVVIALIALALAVLYPLAVLLLRSIKDANFDLRRPFDIPSVFTFENYTFAWEYVKDAFLNSIITTVGVTVGTMICASLLAYAFIRFKFPGKQILFYAIIGLMMIPGILTLISRFQLVQQIGLISDGYGDIIDKLKVYGGIILPGIAGYIPMAFMLLFTFFNSIPKDLFEAADVDGAGDLSVFVNVVVPLSKPILSTIAIQTFVGEWNDYLWANLVKGNFDEASNLPVILQSMSQLADQGGIAYTPLWAGYVLSAIPLVLIFIVASKQFIEGLTSGAFKM